MNLEGERPVIDAGQSGQRGVPSGFRSRSATDLKERSGFPEAWLTGFWQALYTCFTEDIQTCNLDKAGGWMVAVYTASTRILKNWLAIMKRSRLVGLFILLGSGLASLVILLTGCNNTGTTPPVNTGLSSTPSVQTPGTSTPQITTTSPASPATTPDTIATQSPATTETSRNIIINHTNWDWYNSQPQSTVEAVAQQRVFFTHASVGENLLQGIMELNKADSMKYPLLLTAVKSTSTVSTFPGHIYHYMRGNPGWTEKIRIFQESIDNGWHDPVVEIVMNKFCYIDPAANWETYINSMAAMEARYKGTKFIYWTIPITTDKNTDAVRRAQFNQNLRNWIAGNNNKILFDIADIEAWSPEGQFQSFSEKGSTYERMYSGYTNDGGHLNSAGRQRAATGFYSLIGKIVTALPVSGSH
jgi:hypothetical protein